MNMKKHPRGHALALAIALSFSSLLPMVASAHGGEDHAHEDTVAPAVPLLAPRTEAASEDVELLAVHGNGTLTVYLSDFRTNAPLEGVEVEVESAGHTVMAAALAPGVYRAEAPWLAVSGRHALVFTIQGEQVADLLEAHLDIPQPVADEHQEGLLDLSPLGVAGSIGGIAVAGLLAFGLRRRKN